VVQPGAAISVPHALALPAIVELDVTVSDRARRERGESPTFEWTLREDARGSVRVRLDAAVETAQLMLDETPVGPMVTVPASATGRRVLLTVLFDRGSVLAWADKWFLGEYDGPAADATLRLRATGEPGAVTLLEMRAYEVR
jgi:hypothetical protein